MMGEHQMPPGYAAIESALKRAYGGEDPHVILHRPVTKALGGPDVIDDFYVYKVDEPVPYWHLVTAGLTELNEKESDNPEISGFGFEFSLRVRRSETEEGPPHWAANFLENVSKYVFETGNVFAEGHTMNLNGPIAVDRDTEIRAMAMREDPVLCEVDSPHGRFSFLQIVGLTLDELKAMKAWTTDGVLSELAASDPELIVDLERPSILTDPDAAARIAEGTAREGSGTDSLYASPAGYKVSGGMLRRRQARIDLGALGIDEVATILRGRLPFGRTLMLQLEDNRRILLEPGERASWDEAEDRLLVRMPPDVAAELANRMVPKAQEFVLTELPDVTWRITKTVLRRPDGTPIETVG